DAVAAGLERWNLGEVEDVADVEPVAGDLDAAEAVDGEVAERVRRSSGRSEQRSRDAEQEQAFHRASLLAVGAQRTEKRGLSASDARPWSASKSAVSRSVRTPFAASSRSIAPISRYWSCPTRGRPVAA